jgi:putative ABC transport system permease protein
LFLLTLRDLQFRAVRFGIAILGTALVFAMVLLMSGLSAQFRNEPQTTVESIGGDAWVIPEGVTGAFTSGAQVPPTLADDLIAAGAEEADPVALVRHTAKSDGETKDVFLFGHVLGGLGTPELISGEQPGGTGELVASEEANLEVGTTATIGNTEFTVTGLTSKRTIFGGTPLLFVDLADVQALVYQGQDVATAIVAKGEIDGVPDGFEAKTVEETWKDALRPLEKPVGAIDVVQILLWLVAATIIGAVVYLSALERRRDFAVMKAVGASSRGLLAGLATQSVIIALVAAVVATGIAFALVPMFPIPVAIPGRAYIQLPILALFAGALASLGGLRKAVNVDPALAFAGPGG